MKKLLLILFGILLFSGIALAEPSFFYKKGESIDLKVPCSNNGAPCSALATCNLTINYPNSTNLVNNKLMTNNGAFHNYTLPNTTVVGEYQAIVFCLDNREAGYSTFGMYVLNENVYFGDTSILDYKVFLIFIALGLIFFILYLTIRKNIVLGYVSATIFVILGLYSWIQGLSMPINLSVQAYELFNPIVTKAVGTVLTVFALWLYLDSSFAKKKEREEAEFRDEY